MRPCVRSPAVATGLWPVRSTSKLFEERLTELWLQDTYLFATCAAKSKQSGGRNREIPDKPFEWVNNIVNQAHQLPQNNQKRFGYKSRKTAPKYHPPQRHHRTPAT